MCLNYSLSEQSELECEGKGHSEQQQVQWNVGQVSETEGGKKPLSEMVGTGSLSAECAWYFFFFLVSISSFLFILERGRVRACERIHPFLKSCVGTGQPSDRPKKLTVLL